MVSTVRVLKAKVKSNHAPTAQQAATPARSVAARPPVRRVRGLDGMRALAAAAVLFYHLVPGQVRGGFLGVDVFFVLSGFLITALLVREHTANGRINLRAFWIRRIRRLLPAVALMAVVTLIVAGLLNVDLLVGILPQFLGVITFAYNWVEIAIGVSYFDQANPHLWTNVWSLAVEQQFYLAWPVVVLGILALKKKFRWMIPTALAIASSLLMAWLIQGADDYTRAYQGTDSHAFGLMLGALLAFISYRPLQHPQKDPTRFTVWIRGVLAWIGLCVVVGGWFVIPDDQAWVYPWGTLIVCAGMLALMQGFFPSIDAQFGPAQALASALDSRVLVWLGERSYGIYLWHWPVFVMMSNQFPQMFVGMSAVIVAAISIVMAHLSFTFVETPMRYNGIAATLRTWLGPSWHIIDPTGRARTSPRSRDYVRLLMPSLLMVVVIGTVIGMLLSAPDKTRAQLAVERGEANAVQQDDPAQTETDEVAKPAEESPEPEEPVEEETPGPAVPPTGDNVTVIGDSVTVAASPALQEKLPGVAIDAEVSRSIYAGISIVEQQLSEGTLRPYVVMALAANSEMTTDQIEQVINLIGEERRLVLVTGFGPQRLTWIAVSNNSIAEVANAHNDVVQVADWAAAISDRTEHLAADFVHPDGLGGDLYADLVVDALGKF